MQTADGRIAAAAAQGSVLWDWSGRDVSLLCEVAGMGARGHGPILHAVSRSDRAMFCLALHDDGRLQALHIGCGQAVDLSLDLGAEDLTGPVRISYVRHRSGEARLSAELPHARRIRQRGCTGAPPLDPGLLRAALASPARLSPDWAAVGPGAYALGVGAILAAGAHVETPEGPRPVGRLARGDAVLAADGSERSVLGVAQVAVPALGTFRPLRIAAPYFGLRSDILIHPQAQVVLSHLEVEYLTGEEAVLIEARCLSGGLGVRAAAEAPSFLWSGPVLGVAEPVLSGLCGIESADANSLACTPEIAVTTALAPWSGAARPPKRPRLREVRGAEAAALVMALERRHAPLAA